MVRNGWEAVPAMSMAYDRVIELDSNIKASVGFIQGHEDCTICRLDGLPDHEKPPRFLDFSRKLLHAGCTLMGLDLAGLSYISSTGVGAFSSLTLESRGTGKFFFLCSIPDRISKVLNLLGVSDLFSFVDDPSNYA